MLYCIKLERNELKIVNEGACSMKAKCNLLTRLSPNSDQHQISPCNINAYSTPEVMRIKVIVTQGAFS